MDVFLEGSLLLMHSLVTILSGIIYTCCLGLMSLVLLLTKLPQKG